MRRRDQRRAAVFALYQRDLTGRPLDELLDADARPFTAGLARAVEDHRDELDALIARHSEGWTLERVAPLERNLMRVALLELAHPELVAGREPVPAEAAIDEAVETAKTYCGADAPAFVNGVLGAALESVRQNRARS
ncbi:MAG TPA: transcription antitermination factor NusB [Solirubrobacteraceae bacterium]|nr:transcription antitermination factor NusB [Solirubrobacteraceae bacterium]